MADAVVFNEFAPGGPIEQLNTLLGATISATDPTVNTDSTQGFSVNSLLFNNTAGILRLWRCRDATPGAAKWILNGVDYINGGTNPAAEVTQFGLGAALMAEEGNINRQLSIAGVSPGATGADNVLAVFSIPAGSFDVNGRGLNITAQGKFGATANNKQVKLIFNPSTAVVGSTVGAGGTTIADTGTVATNGLGWSVSANVFKAGAAGSNTQIALHQQSQTGGTVSSLLAPTFPTAVESGAILVAVTGNAATATSDIVLNFLEVNAMN